MTEDGHTSYTNIVFITYPYIKDNDILITAMDYQNIIYFKYSTTINTVTNAIIRPLTKRSCPRMSLYTSVTCNMRK